MRAAAATLLILYCTGVAEGEDIRQSLSAFENTACGPYALQACANYLNVPVRQSDIERHLPTTAKETTFAELSAAAQELGFTTLAVRWTDAPDLFVPAILPVRQNGRSHFIAAVARRDDEILVIDSPRKLWIRASLLREQYGWNGDALHVGSYRSSALLYLRLHKNVALSTIVALTVSVVALRRWLRRTTVPAAKAIAIVILLCTVAGCDDGGLKARISPATTTVSLSDSTAKNGEIETWLFVHNEGANDFKVTKVVATCACTSIEPLSQNKVASGESVRIALRIRPPDIGQLPVHVSVDVESEATRQKLTSTIHVRGRPIRTPEFAKVPDEIIVRCAPDSNEGTRILIQTYERQAGPPWIRKVTIDGDALRSVNMIGTQESSGPEPGVIIRLYTFLAHPAIDRSTSIVRLRETFVSLWATESATPLRRIPVSLRAWDPIRLAPTAMFIDLSPNSSDNSVTRDVRVLLSDDGIRPETMRIITRTVWIDAQLAPLSESTGTTEATLTIKLKLAEMPVGSSTLRGSAEIEVSDTQGRIAMKRLDVTVKR